MIINRTDMETISVIHVPARLTMSTANAWRHGVRDVVDCGYGRLVLDMSQVEFLDSTGLSALVGVLKACRAAGGEAVLSGITTPVRALIELTRMHHIFEIFADQGAAAHYLQRSEVA